MVESFVGLYVLFNGRYDSWGCRCVNRSNFFARKFGMKIILIYGIFCFKLERVI